MDGKAGCPRVRALTRRGGALDRSITAGHLPTSLWLRFGGFGERDIIMTLRNILLGATMLCAATTPAYAFAQDAAAPADTGTTIDDSDYGNDIIVTASTDRNRQRQNTSELQSLMRISYSVFCLN